MKVVAIDPGTNSLGWCVLDKEMLYDYGVLQFNDRDPLLDRLNMIYTQFHRILSDYPDCQIFALEKSFSVDRGSLALVVAIRVLKEVAQLVEGLVTVQALAVSVRKHFGVGARNKDIAKERMKQRMIKYWQLEDDLEYDVYDAVGLGTWAVETA